MSLIGGKEKRISIKNRKNRSRKGNPKNFIDETGQRFGRLTVLLCDGRWKNTNEATWLCKCDCGNELPGVRGIYLRQGETKSCGCLHKEWLAQRNKSEANPLKEEYRAKATKLRELGLSYSKIAQQFTSENIPSLRGGKWYGSTIKWLLS